ncbi:hypothetical protein [Streptomyces sp. NPDC046870]|uniref:hypothetical protein n=1 Tax=Streptomyces sp. NPDC046870 TaxID=3155135 RepID=UPI00345132DB
MRDLPVRRLASTVLCASVLLGITGPAAVAADPSRGHDRAASRAPVQTAEKEKLLARARALGTAAPALGPVVDLLNQSLEKGRLSAGEAGRLGEAAKQAVVKAAGDPKPAAPTAPAQATPTASAAPAASAKPTAPASATSTVKPEAPSAPATGTASAKPATGTASAKPATAPSSPTASATPTKPTTATPTAPATSAEPARPTAAASASAPAVSAAPAALTARAAERHPGFVDPPASRDLADDALSELETAIDNLVKAVTGQLDQLLSSATDVVSGLAGLLDPTLLDEDTTAPSVESLPSLPSLPTEPSPSATS